jgi:hypothetical protein
LKRPNNPLLFSRKDAKEQGRKGLPECLLKLPNSSFPITNSFFHATAQSSQRLFGSRKAAKEQGRKGLPECPLAEPNSPFSITNSFFHAKTQRSRGAKVFLNAF